MILASYYGYKPSRRKRGKAGVSSSPTEADIAFASICGPVVPFFRLPPDEQQALLDLEGCKTIAEYKAKMKSLRN